MCSVSAVWSVGEKNPEIQRLSISDRGDSEDPGMHTRTDLQLAVNKGTLIVSALGDKTQPADCSLSQWEVHMNTVEEF